MYLRSCAEAPKGGIVPGDDRCDGWLMKPSRTPQHPCSRRRKEAEGVDAFENPPPSIGGYGSRSRGANRFGNPLLQFALVAVATLVPFTLPAQSSLPVFTDSLVSGFQDWGWAQRSYTNTSPVHTGTRSVSVTVNAAWEGIQIVRTAFDARPYQSVSFWAHGGPAGGQQLQIAG